jgi:hypothetical protein
VGKGLRRVEGIERRVEVSFCEGDTSFRASDRGGCCRWVRRLAEPSLDVPTQRTRLISSSANDRGVGIGKQRVGGGAHERHERKRMAASGMAKICHYRTPQWTLHHNGTSRLLRSLPGARVVRCSDAPGEHANVPGIRRGERT